MYIRGQVKATSSLLIVKIKVILYLFLLNQNNAEYQQLMNAFTYEMFLCVGIESFIEAILSWYHVTVNNRTSFYLNKNFKKV